MRLGEIRGLGWEQVDFLDGVIRLNAGETKNDEGRVIPIFGDLVAGLRAEHAKRHADCPFVCFRVTRQGKAVRLGDFRKVWHARCVKLGLGRMEGEKYFGLIFHDLRRTFITDAEHAGTPRHEVMKGTGHKTESVYRRYAIGSREGQQVAMDKIAAWRAARKGENSGKMAESAPPQESVKSLPVM